MDLYSLPTGTKFYVKNGAWNGQILEENGEKYVLVLESGEKRKISPNKNYRLEIRTHEGILQSEIDAKAIYNKTTFLINATKNCEHDIQAQLAGGIKCTKCGGWFCY